MEMSKKTTNAEIVSIGSELLLGQIVDTNSSWMAKRLTEIGVNLFYKTVVGDNPKRMIEVISCALERSDVVIVGGGLGPTQDDLTREVIATVTGCKLVLDDRLLEQINHRFRERGVMMTANNERQAYMPDGAIPVNNPNGTAPAFIVEGTQGVIFALPGVPFEMKWLFTNEVVPYLRKKFGLSEIITYKVLKVAELGESRVDHLVGHLITNSVNPTVGVLAHPGQVDVRITAKAVNNNEAIKLIEPIEEEIRNLLGRNVFGVDDETIEDVVGGLLRKNNATISVYEDMTAGLVAERCQKAGSNRFLTGSVGNNSESMDRLLKNLGMSQIRDISMNDPAVLTQTLAMAIRVYSGSDLGVALHAIPHPGEDAQNLAKGQTFVSITDGEQFRDRSYDFGGRGIPDRTRMSFNAIDLLRLVLEEGF